MGENEATGASSSDAVAQAATKERPGSKEPQGSKAGNDARPPGTPALPPKPRAKRHFAHPPDLPLGPNLPVYEEDVIGHLQSDVVNTQMGPVPKVFAGRKVAVDTLPANYTDELRYTAEASGFKGAAGRMLRANARQIDKKQRQAAAADPGVEPGSVHLGDQEIRKAFGVLDLLKDGQLTADELKHVFAQLGELPTKGEIEAMLHVCDRRGEEPPAVTFEDFSAVMMHPGEALRRIEPKKLREIMNEGKVSD